MDDGGAVVKAIFVICYAILTMLILMPFLAVGFLYGFIWWGFMAGRDRAEAWLDGMPERIKKSRDELSKRGFPIP